MFNAYDANTLYFNHWEEENIHNWNQVFKFKIKERCMNKIGQFQFKVLYDLLQEKPFHLEN